MITIYHNPRCSKSRQGLAIIEQSGKEYEVIKYLENPLKIEDLKKILEYLQITPIELVRKGEVTWKEKYKGKQMNDDAIIEAMVTYPKLIERPIVTNSKRAVIGRPPEKIKEIL